MMHDETPESPRTGDRNGQDRDQPRASSLGKQARKRIGVHLRAMYDTMAQQPVPSRFSDLIAQLDDTATEKA